MPFHDGTGPNGYGAGSGRGSGQCKTGFNDDPFGKALFREKRGWLFGLAAPLLIAAIRDLAHPSGLWRQNVRALLSDKINKKPQILRDAQYSVVEQNLNNGKNLSGKSENEHI
jgi:hypothetical protein